MDYCYRFPVVKGVQAKHVYYIAMVPLGMLGKLFPENEDEYVLPEYRAQRKLNESRIPEIKNYILDNPETYVFSALAASIDGEFQYIPSNNKNIGTLEVSLDARFLINDGQHRKAALLAAIEERHELVEETISVVFFEDQGLARSQQMFTDLNKHAVKTSNSISELYDSRDPLAVVTRKVIGQISFLEEYVDKEKDNLGKYSSSLFTLNTFYTANKRIIGRNEFNAYTEKFLLKYWQAVVDNMVPWKEVNSKEISKKELREQFIATQSVIIQAFGRLGNYFIENPDLNVNDSLSQIGRINWKRNCDDWKYRVIKANGRMINNSTAIILACNVIKKYINLPLTDDEISVENNYLQNMRG